MCRRPSGNISGRSFEHSEHLRLAVAGGGGYAAGMKQVFPVVALSFLLMAPLGAVPNVFFSNGTGNFPVIPAFPRFNADLTEEFLDPVTWRKAEFSGPWEDEPSLPDLAVRRMSAMPTVFGEVPMSIQSFEKEGGVAEIAIHFLDAGVFFGYLGGETTKEQRDAMRQRRVEFSRYYRDLSASLQEKLEQGCGRGVAGRLGRSPMLSLGYIDFTWEDFTLRSVEREAYHREVAGTGTPPRPLSPAELEQLPRRDSRGSPSHASVVTGIEPDHGTILYVEPWGHDGLGRRMRIEEAEATTYAVFYFKL